MRIYLQICAIPRAQIKTSTGMSIAKLCIQESIKQTAFE